MNEKTLYLPPEAYPKEWSFNQKLTFDQQLKARQGELPTEPNKYLDRTGALWILDDEGCWTDNRGERRSQAWTPAVVIFGPMTLAAESNE